MHGPTLASLILAASILGAGGAAPPISLPQRVADARRALAENRPTAAIDTLEAALAGSSPTAAADKQAVLGLLRQAFEAAALQADGAGRTREADSHRENARILGRKTGGAAPVAPPTAPPESPAPESPAVAPEAAVAPLEPISLPGETLAEAPTALPAMPTPTELVEPPTDRPEPTPAAERGSNSATPVPERLPDPRLDPVPGPAPTGPLLADADAAFGAKRFPEAGRIYGLLARENRLPADRVEAWAYCRSFVVARRISARPRTDAEWKSIHGEIEQIRRLAPTNWLGDYMRDAATARSAVKKVPMSGATVVRAASPEEPPARPARPARAGRAAATPAVIPAATPLPAPAPGQTAVRVDNPMMTDPSAPPGVPVGRWRVRESANFRVFHANPELAEQVVQVAESVRREATKRWSGKLPAAPWQPRCEIYLFPNGVQYAQMTGQPADSPGFSTMGMNQGQIISRRVNVRTDHAGLLTAVLPHEVTHVILADFFTEEQIPRWADEGMAVLTEPTHEQKRRATDLVEPLGKNLLFPIETLMKMDYPDNRYWSLYYAQSVSLTRFLVEQGSPAQFIQFLQGAQSKGFEAELKRVYKIDGFADLQARWVAYARSNTEGETPTATASNDPKPNARTR